MGMGMGMGTAGLIGKLRDLGDLVQAPWGG